MVGLGGCVIGNCKWSSPPTSVVRVAVNKRVLSMKAIHAPSVSMYSLPDEVYAHPHFAPSFTEPDDKHRKCSIFDQLSGSPPRQALRELP